MAVEFSLIGKVQNTSSPQIPFIEFPHELLFLVFANISIPSIRNVALACRTFKNITKTPAFWKCFYLHFVRLKLFPLTQAQKEQGYSFQTAVARIHFLIGNLSVLTKSSTCGRAQALAYDPDSKTYAIGFHRDHGCCSKEYPEHTRIIGLVGSLLSSDAPVPLNQMPYGLHQINDLTIDSAKQAIIAVGRPAIVTQHNFKGEFLDKLYLGANEEYDAFDMHIASEDQNWIATKAKLVSRKDKSRSDIGYGHILYTDPTTSSLIVQKEDCLAYYKLDSSGHVALDHEIHGAHLADLNIGRFHREWKLHYFCPQQGLLVCMTEDKKGILFWDLKAKKPKIQPLILLDNSDNKYITCIHYNAESNLLFAAILDCTSDIKTSEIKIYTGTLGILINSIEFGNDRVQFLDYDPSTRLLLTSSCTNNIELWNCETGKKVKILHKTNKDLYKIHWEKTKDLFTILENGPFGWSITEYTSRVESYDNFQNICS